MDIKMVENIIAKLFFSFKNSEYIYLVFDSLVLCALIVNAMGN